MMKLNVILEIKSCVYDNALFVLIFKNLSVKSAIRSVVASVIRYTCSAYSLF